VSPENIPGNIRLHFPVLVEETNFSCVVVFQFTSNEFGFSVAPLGRLLLLDILATVM